MEWLVVYRGNANGRRKSDKAMTIDIAYRFGNSYCSIERERRAKAKRTTAITTRVTPSCSCGLDPRLAHSVVDVFCMKTEAML